MSKGAGSDCAAKAVPPKPASKTRAAPQNTVRIRAWRQSRTASCRSHRGAVIGLITATIGESSGPGRPDIWSGLLTCSPRPSANFNTSVGHRTQARRRLSAHDHTGALPHDTGSGEATGQSDRGRRAGCDAMPAIQRGGVYQEVILERGHHGAQLGPARDVGGPDALPLHEDLVSARTPPRFEPRLKRRLA